MTEELKVITRLRFLNILELRTPNRGSFSINIIIMKVYWIWVSINITSSCIGGAYILSRTILTVVTAAPVVVMIHQPLLKKWLAVQPSSFLAVEKKSFLNTQTQLGCVRRRRRSRRWLLHSIGGEKPIEPSIGSVIGPRRALLPLTSLNDLQFCFFAPFLPFKEG